jgi:ATP/maltotriose-dependent transcriptional regulator MalT
MATGDGFAAVGHARRAAVASGSTGSARHAVKSDVVLAAAQCCAGDLAESRRVADAALDAAQRHGLVPLSWALACLLADVGSSEYSPTEVAAVRDDAAATVRNRGGVWSGR